MIRFQQQTREDQIVISNNFQTLNGDKVSREEPFTTMSFTSCFSNLEAVLNLEATDRARQSKRSVIAGTKESMKESLISGTVKQRTRRKSMYLAPCTQSGWSRAWSGGKACGPSTQKVEEGQQAVQGQPWLHSNLRPARAT